MGISLISQLTISVNDISSNFGKTISELTDGLPPDSHEFVIVCSQKSEDVYWWKGFIDEFKRKIKRIRNNS